VGVRAGQTRLARGSVRHEGGVNEGDREMGRRTWVRGRMREREEEEEKAKEKEEGGGGGGREGGRDEGEG
jgi:hypothetical protein